MPETAPPEPSDDDVVVHSFRPGQLAVRWSVNLAYGHGEPHHFVAIDVESDEPSWWLTPEDAEHLGALLTRRGAEARSLNEHRPGGEADR